jgi:hypothetical protein
MLKINTNTRYLKLIIGILGVVTAIYLVNYVFGEKKKNLIEGMTDSVFFLKDNATVNIDTSKTYKLINMYNNEPAGRLYSNADGRFGITTGGEYVDQYWNLVALPQQNTFKFTSVNSSKSLYNTNNKVYVSPTQYEDNSQDWKLIPVKGQSDVYQLKSLDTNNCLYNGYDINTDTCSQQNILTNNQFWKFIPVEEGPKKCDQYKDTDKNLPDECLNKLWREAGCTTNLQDSVMAPFYKNKTMAEIKSDMSAWATDTDPMHRAHCYAPIPKPNSGTTINTDTLWSKAWTKLDDMADMMKSWSQMKDGTILGINFNGQLLEKKNESQGMWSEWTPINNPSNGAIKDLIQLNSGNYLMLAGAMGLFTNDKLEDKNWKIIDNDTKKMMFSITQLDNGNIIGVAYDNSIYQKKNLLAEWTKINCPSTCCVTYISTMNDGTIVGVGTDGFVYTKTTFNKEWVLVDNSKKMTSVLQLQDGSIIGIDKTGYTFYKRNETNDIFNRERKGKYKPKQPDLVPPPKPINNNTIAYVNNVMSYANKMNDLIVKYEGTIYNAPTPTSAPCGSLCEKANESDCKNPRYNGIWNDQSTSAGNGYCTWTGTTCRTTHCLVRKPNCPASLCEKANESDCKNPRYNGVWNDQSTSAGNGYCTWTGNKCQTTSCLIPKPKPSSHRLEIGSLLDDINNKVSSLKGRIDMVQSYIMSNNNMNNRTAGSRGGNFYREQILAQLKDILNDNRDIVYKYTNIVKNDIPLVEYLDIKTFKTGMKSYTDSINDDANKAILSI